MTNKPNEPSTYPELIVLAAEAAGVTPDDVAAAIKCALDLLPEKPTVSERAEVYVTWLDPVARPLAEAGNLSVDHVCLALVASLQVTEGAK